VSSIWQLWTHFIILSEGEGEVRSPNKLRKWIQRCNLWRGF